MHKLTDLMALWGYMKNERTHHEQMWKTITAFCAPDRNFWTAMKEKRGEVSRNIFDGTPMSAVNIMANALQGYMASKVTKSFEVSIDHPRIIGHYPFEGRVRQYIQELDEGLSWMINHSNFYDAVNEIFRVGGTIATAVVYADKVPGENRIVNHIAHANDVWIAENDSRVVDTVARVVRMSARDIVSRWGDKVPESLRELAKKSPLSMHEVLHMVVPRAIRDVTKIDNLNKPYASFWILAADRILLSESGFDYNPYVTWRWSTPNSSTYGWGPSHSAMAEVLRINRITKTMVDAAHLSVFPAMNVPAEARGRLNLEPRGMNPYVDPSRIVTPIQQVGQYPIGRDREEDVREIIRQHYHVDMFVMMTQHNAYGNRTATEVLEMQAEKAAIMGAVTSRIEGELFDRLFDRYFEIGMREGWLPAPPPEAYDILQGAEIKVDYIGPMSQIQNRFYQKQSIDIPIQRMLAYAEVMPEMLDVINTTELATHMANESNLPESVIRSRQEVIEIQAARAQIMAQAQQAELNQANARAAKDFSQAQGSGPGQGSEEDVLQMLYSGGR